MNPFQYYNPTMLIFGPGKLSLLAKQAETMGEKVLLVYGGGSIKTHGVYERVIQALQKSGKQVFELSGVEPNPRVSTARKGIELCRNHQIDWVLAVGGGSVIDCAKAIAVGSTIDADVWDLVRSKVTARSALPLGVVLTLAATGSEMNPYSVITNWETNEKIGWGSPLAIPKFSILDPELTYTLPHDQTVYGVVDIMSHVLEQYFHHQEHTAITDGFCETILRSVIEYAPLLKDDPNNEDSRSTIMHAGTVALNGITSMGTIGDWATHNLEHAVSAIFDIPHGGGLAILFPVWIRYALDRGTAPKKVAQLGINVFGLKSTDFKDELELGYATIIALEKFWRSLGAPATLSDYQITLDDAILESLADKTLIRGPFGRFQKLDRANIIEIYRRAQ